MGLAPAATALTGSFDEASSPPPATAAVDSAQRDCSDTRGGSTDLVTDAIIHESMDLHSKPIGPALTTAAQDNDEQALAEAAAMFRALADPERLRLLVRLAGGEASVTQLAGDQKLTTVSARLQFLLAARLVRRRRDARQMFYALADEHVIDLLANAMDHASERQGHASRTHSSPRGPQR